MTLEEYIKELQSILETEGNLNMFTARDPEGNSYNRADYLPEIRLIPKGEEDSYCVEYLYNQFDPEKQTIEEYIDENCLDEDDFDLDNMVKVILL